MDLKAPSGGWMLIAVDNDSRDRTCEIMCSFIDKLPITIIHEAKRGKNNALNKAIPLARGDLIVFTDDDVLPNTDWLVKLEKCSLEHPEHGYFGGTILPEWPMKPPDWIINDNLPLDMLYAITQKGVEGEVGINEIWGPNMAIRRSVLDLGFRYSENVGPDGTPTYIMGSETELLKRLHKSNIKGWFCKSIVVKHIIRANQLSEKWVIERFARYGRSLYVNEFSGGEIKKKLLGYDRYLVRQLISANISSLFCFMVTRKKDRIQSNPRDLALRHIF